MSKKVLIIVESPSKVNTIKKYLGKEYDVDASYGHIVDLDKKSHKGLGIDVDNNYEPVYKIITEKSYAKAKSKSQIVKFLKEKAKQADLVLLASDPDREGEAIAWHLAQVLKHKNMKRITFNEITKKAILEAIEKPRDIDMQLFYSQQARRILDRLVGFTLSPVLWAKVEKGISAGRVQTPALIVMADREKEIQAFVPEKYWDIYANVVTNKGDAYQAKLFKISNKKVRVKDENKAIEICKDIELNWDNGAVDVIKSKATRSPQPPFITSTLQRAANSILGWTASVTMQVAQQLYEAGHITYMRTDSVRINDDTLKEMKKVIVSDYGDKYYKSRTYKTKDAAQDAHEAIRPSHIEVKSAGVDKSQNDLYELIRNRTLASQMSDAVLDETHVNIMIDKEKYCLEAKGQTIVFDGFSRLWPLGNIEQLPEIISGIKNNKLKCVEKQEKTTKAPPRFSEAKLVEVLEKEGVGRPSTYAAIMETLVKRKYVVREGSGKSRVLKVTELGIQVSDFLREYFSDYLSMGFTAKMEQDLDGVANGEVEWYKVIDKIYPPMSRDAKKIKSEKEQAGKNCPECGSELVYRVGKSGKFIGCGNYPKCKYTEFLDNDKKLKYTGDNCPECGGQLLERKGKYGVFVGCSGYPNCKYIKKDEEPSRGKCPECGGEIVKKFSKKMKKNFYGCNNYPDCKYIEK